MDCKKIAAGGGGGGASKIILKHLNEFVPPINFSTLAIASEKTAVCPSMKKYITLLCLTVATIPSFAKDLNKATQPIIEEGKRLYRSEMASWYGTDVFLSSYSQKENIGGYFSYAFKDSARCVFYSKEDQADVIGTVTFDNTYNVETARIETLPRNFTAEEKTLYELRRAALNTMRSDTMFKMYQDMNLNVIPLISGKERKVYVLSGTQRHDLVLFGNDYLMTFDKNNKLKEKKPLHQNLIPIEYGQDSTDHRTIHSHLPETGDFITATDICTLMLYQPLTKWKTHIVVSQRYVNIWSCETNQLIVITRDAMEKINADQKKRHPEAVSE